jgi:hypothetical protein
MSVIKKTNQIFITFCDSTSIHGFSYIAQSSRWKIERFFWLFSILTSLALTGTLIRKLIVENRHNPTIIYTDQNVVHVTDILFPSVSITPGLILKTPIKTGIDYVAVKQELTNGAAKIENFTQIELKRLQIASLIARDGFMAQFNLSIPTDDFVQRLRDFPSMWRFMHAEKIGDIARLGLARSEWGGKYTVNFTEVLCPTGFCYTFNFPNKIEEILNVRTLSSDFNYTNFVRAGSDIRELNKYLRHSPYPVHGLTKGKGLLLRALPQYEDVHNYTEYVEIKESIKKFLQTNHEFYKILKRLKGLNVFYDIFEHVVPTTQHTGLPIVIHAAHEVILARMKTIFLEPGTFIDILIKPKVIIYDSTLEDMDYEE